MEKEPIKKEFNTFMEAVYPNTKLPANVYNQLKKAFYAGAFVYANCMIEAAKSDSEEESVKNLDALYKEVKTEITNMIIADSIDEMIEEAQIKNKKVN